PDQPTILGQTATLAANAEEALRLSVAAAIGELRLTLKPIGDNSQTRHTKSSAADLDRPLAKNDAKSSDEEEPKEVQPRTATPTGPGGADPKGARKAGRKGGGKEAAAGKEEAPPAHDDHRERLAAAEGGLPARPAQRGRGFRRAEEGNQARAQAGAPAPAP